VTSQGLRRTRPGASSLRDGLWLALKFFTFVGVALLLWWLAGHEVAQTWKHEARPLPFFTAMAVLPSLGIPVTPFLLLAGATFGTAAGLVGSLVAIAANLLLSFWIARGGLRPMLERMIERTNYSLPSVGEGRAASLRFATLVKLAPGIPGIKHYVIVLAGVPLPIYLFVCLGITGLYAVALVFIGESLLDHDLVKLVGADAALLALIAGAAFVYWRVKKRGRGAPTSGRESSVRAL
jgi:uncharacterized membrane protein YdjX (TVP38/TMEM64 family)